MGSEQGSIPPGKGPRLLVADDEPEILSLVVRHVKKKASEVYVASDGQEALQLAQEHKPDLIVLDVMMPGMSGWEVCRAIRDDENLRRTPVLMLTGIGERLNEMTSPLYGANDFLDKPFEPEDLLEKVEGLLAQRDNG